MKELTQKYNTYNTKRIYGFGDSIIYGHAAGISFLDYLERNYSLSVTKYAVNGATVIGGSGNAILPQITEASSIVPDFVLFDGLINDAYTTVTDDPNKLGSISNGFAEIFDTSTFCGGFESICQTLLKKYRGATIIFIAVHKTPARDYIAQETLQYLAKQICCKWSIPVVDLYNASGLNCFISDYQYAYSYDQVDANGGNSSTGGSGTHPNDVGYMRYYMPMITAKMNELS
ncbi:SGNH/GDSL hydrolase family protein [Paenibacillus sp. WST5]|uniref:SGNH/GDSL hydrolase family protein n=2 Tax=Paenibacillus sedimenti TaxID=2770274 RepID=A0A926KWU7_9BACL|nr:SGNH/GDSL hydrolase family protein [Paenibacillus sedimenti]